jgi:hypothetical protein
MKTMIIQTSPTHTASTFLVNAIYGLITELFDKKIIFDELNKDTKISNYNFDNIICFTSFLI